MSDINFNIYQSIQKSKKLSEQYIGSFPMVWWYAIGTYKADCTEALPFTLFDKVICGLLSVEKSLGFQELAEILGLNVIDNPENNQYKDFAEEEILKEALQSLYDFGMIEIGDAFYSNCYLTELGKEYTTKGKKFKTTENKRFKLYFDCFTNQHNNGKSVFEDLKGNSFDFHTDIDFEDENYLKIFAEKQIPEIYDTQKGNSFTNSELIKLEKFSVQLYVCVLFDLQTREYNYIIFNPQSISSNKYFSDAISENKDLQDTVNQNITKNFSNSNLTISKEQINYENQLVTTQNEIEIHLHEGKENEATDLFKSTISNLEYIDTELFWLNLNNFISNDCTEFWLRVPYVNEQILQNIKNLISQNINRTKFFIALPILENADFENDFNTLSIKSDNLYLVSNVEISMFFSLVIQTNRKQEILSNKYIFEFNGSIYQKDIFRKSNWNETTEKRYAAQKKYFANELLPEIIENAYTKINVKPTELNKQFIAVIQNADIKISDLYNFANDQIKADLEELAKYKAEKVSELISEYKNILNDKIKQLNQAIEAEPIENLKKVNDFNTQIKNIENELFDELSDLKVELSITNKKLAEIEFYIKDQLLAKTYIIDTNIFIVEPEIIEKIDKKHKIVLSAKVTDELDNLKRNKDIKDNAGKALKLINQQLGKNPKLKTARADFKKLPRDFNDRSPDNKILAVALMYKDDNPVLLTNDNGLQIKAKTCEIPTLSLKQFLNPEPESKNLKLPINLKTNKVLEFDSLIKAIQNSWNNKTQKFELSSLNNSLKIEIQNFDFKDYGFEKFKDFCLALTDVFEIETKENGTAIIKPKFEIQPIVKTDVGKITKPKIELKSKIEKPIKPFPLEKAKSAFMKCKRDEEGKVNTKDYFNQMQIEIPGFNPNHYGGRFNDFYKKAGIFEIIVIDMDTKFLKLKDNVKI
jgi:rRNA-processing protein FCF1